MGLEQEGREIYRAEVLWVGVGGLSQLSVLKLL